MQTAFRILVLLSIFVGVVYTTVLTPDEPYDSLVLDGIAELNAELVDRPAPYFELSDVDGTPHRLTDYRGRFVFLNFWASWCAPCREEMPSMRELSARFEGREFVMIAVSHDEDRNAMVGFLAETEIDADDMLVLQDPEGAVARQFGTELLPETYLIDDEGRIIARFQNAYDWEDPAVIRLLERVMQRDWRL